MNKQYTAKDLRTARMFTGIFFGLIEIGLLFVAWHLGGWIAAVIVFLCVPLGFIGLEVTFSSDIPFGRAAPPPDTEYTDDLLGRECEPTGPLRPMGTIELDGAKYNARCELGMVSRGDRIKVVTVEPNCLIVELRSKQPTT